MMAKNAVVATSLSIMWLASIAQTLHSSAPLEFYFSMGAATWPDNVALELTDGQIVCKKWDGRKLETFFRKLPTEDEWKQFRDDLDRSKIWLWRKHYINLQTYDGTRWEIRAKFADKEIVSNGLNQYPDARGRPSNSYENGIQFQAFVNAVKNIAPECRR